MSSKLPKTVQATVKVSHQDPSKLALGAGLLRGMRQEKESLESRQIAPVIVAEPVISEQAGSPAAGRIPISVADCISNPYNPRTFYPEAQIQQLALTLQREGQIEAIKVTRLPQYPGKYVLVDGERRLRAFKYLARDVIDAEMRSEQEPMDLYTTAFHANHDHQSQTVFDDAIAWQKLLDDNVFPTQEALAERVGKERVYITKVLTLNALPSAMLERMAESSDVVGLTSAYLIKQLFERADEELADRALSAVIEGKKSTRDLEAQLRDLKTGTPTVRRERRTYQFKYDFRVDGKEVGKLKAFGDGRLNLDITNVPLEKQDALAEAIKAVVKEHAGYDD